MAASPRLAGPYAPPDGLHDEAVAPDGDLRPEAALAVGPLLTADLAVLSQGVDRAAGRAGVAFGEGTRFHVDPVPRAIAGVEWDALCAGLTQRARALDRLVADVHGARDCVAAGVLGERVVASATKLDPAARELPPPSGRWIGVAGIDVVRGADGVLRVLEDNCRTPSGIAYAMACRELVGDLVDPDALEGVRGHEGVPRRLLEALRHAAPPGAGDDPAVALLTDGPANAAFYEHRRLAAAMGVPLVTPAEVALRGDELWTTGPRARRLDAVYRRTDADQLASPIGELLAGPLRASTLGLVNAYGTGIADDKLVHAHVEELVRFYLGEEPLLASVRSLDLTEPAALEEALDRIAELVVKPRDGHGGHGVVIGSEVGPEQLDALRRELQASPGSHVAQERVHLSTHPTVVDGGLEPRHVDLRPFVLLGPDGPEVLPAALTRVALGAGQVVVNSSRQGGAKDTWVLAS